jgi:hypothetical protein
LSSLTADFVLVVVSELRCRRFYEVAQTFRTFRNYSTSSHFGKRFSKFCSLKVL